MESYFSKQFFANNRAKLKKLFIGTAPIIITANGLIQSGADSTYPFKQDASFWYLTGLDLPDLILVMDKGQEYLIIPSRNINRQNFDGQIDIDQIRARSGIDELYNEDEGWNKLNSRLKKVKHIATLATPKTYIEDHGFYTNPARASLNLKIKEINEDIKFLDLSHHLALMRMIKQPEELNAINRAIDITSQSIKQSTGKNKLLKYQYEYQLEASLTKIMIDKGSGGHAFEPIVAGGINACTLHNISNKSRFNQNDLVVIDTGCEVEHYAADITRTLSLSGKPNKRQNNIYDAVLDVQNFGISLLKPGLLLKDFEDKIENYMGEKLRELGLIKTISHENVRQFYPHATSHFLGLNAHDIGDYNRPLEPGVVLTVEPGIYVKKESIGIRIEDDVLITGTGNTVLSKKLAKKL